MVLEPRIHVLLYIFLLNYGMYCFTITISVIIQVNYYDCLSDA